MSFALMNCLEQKQHPTNFVALTSLTPAEFDYLLLYFTPLWEKYYKYHTLEGKKRTLPAFAEHGNALLKGTDQKLFFLLVYMKNKRSGVPAPPNLSGCQFWLISSQSVQNLSHPPGHSE